MELQEQAEGESAHQQAGVGCLQEEGDGGSVQNTAAERKKIQRGKVFFLNGRNIHLFLKLVASPADRALDKGGDEPWPHHQVVEQPIASKSRTAEKFPCTPLGKDLQQLPQTD